MIVENLIANFDIQEEDFGLQESNLLQIKEHVRKFSKMNSHEPTTNWSQVLRDSQLTNNNNQNGNTIRHQYKKTLTSASFESNVFVKGNLVFTNQGGGSHQSTPRKYEEGDQQLQQVTYVSPIFSREATIKKKSKELTECHENDGQEDSTNEKIQEHQSSGSITPNSNQAIESHGDTSQEKHLQQFEYERAESNIADVRSSDNSQNESQINQNKSFVKSKFSRNKVSDSIFKKKTSFSDHERDDSDQNNEKMSPKSLQNIKLPTQQIIIQSHQQIPNNQQENVQKLQIQQQGKQTNGYQRNQFITPAQRRRSQLQPVETNKFQTLAQKKREEMNTGDPNSPNTPFSPKEKFKILGTVARTLSRLQVNQVSRIESTEQLDREMDMMKQLKQNSSFLGEKNQSNKYQEKNEEKHNDVNIAFNMVRMVEMITDLAERGHPEDINSMIDILQKDPKKYIRSTDDPMHLLNKLNSKNQNAAYVACKNGNINIVQFLVKQEINFNIKSRVGGSIEEFPLQAAVRWNHKDIIDFVLNQRVIKISQEQIKQAYKEAKSKNELKKIIAPHLKKKPFFLCC